LRSRLDGLRIFATHFAHGQVDFFGEQATVWMDGAGGQTCTILPQAMFFVDLAA